jgi:purine-binding chemotaxis protein CheW
MMSESIQKVTDQVVVFTLDKQLYALSLHAVLKVIHTVEIRHLPEAPEIIAGIINIKGRIIPVADIRKRLGLPTREIDLNDKIIIADTGKREIAINVDTVTGIQDIESLQLAFNNENRKFAEHIRGVAKIDDDLVLIYDLGHFLNLDEETELKKSLNNNSNES